MLKKLPLNQVKFKKTPLNAKKTPLIKYKYLNNKQLYYRKSIKLYLINLQILKKLLKIKVFISNFTKKLFLKDNLMKKMRQLISKKTPLILLND